MLDDTVPRPTASNVPVGIQRSVTEVVEDRIKMWACPVIAIDIGWGACRNLGTSHITTLSYTGGDCNLCKNEIEMSA